LDTRSPLAGEMSFPLTLSLGEGEQPLPGVFRAH
jgi:hypothetical protein